MAPFKNVIYQNNQPKKISSWYSNHAYFGYQRGPWIHRGGGYDVGSGSEVFAFGYGAGEASHIIGFRVVLTP